MLISSSIGVVFSKTVSKEGRLTFMFLCMVTTFLSEIISYVLRIIILDSSFDFLAFIKIVLIEIVYNTLLIIIFYPLIHMFGEWIKQVFTEDRIKTRYF